MTDDNNNEENKMNNSCSLESLSISSNESSTQAYVSMSDDDLSNNPGRFYRSNSNTPSSLSNFSSVSSLESDEECKHNGNNKENSDPNAKSCDKMKNGQSSETETKEFIDKMNEISIIFENLSLGVKTSKPKFEDLEDENEERPRKWVFFLTLP